mmetsp:Transcript_56774/g.166151  ORF Transcript_56774/g.166151 Transcript_56774/m.166151 type:complete len:257 (+) Transcript_56774:766-1536(+)
MPLGGQEAASAVASRLARRASSACWSARSEAANSSSCSQRSCAASLTILASALLLCSSRASSAATKPSTTASLLVPCERESTFMASTARGRTMASDGKPSGASCCRCGPRRELPRPRQKTAFSPSRTATSSEASTKFCRPSDLVVPDCAQSPSWTAATSSPPRLKASVRASSKLPSNAGGPGSTPSAKGSSSEAGTMASVPSSRWQRASLSATNSTQQRRPSERYLAKLPSGRSARNCSCSRAFCSNSLNSAFSRH